MSFIRFFETLSRNDVPLVGGKNASLGEMISSLKNQGICVPDGFATTSDAYRLFINHNQLKEKITALLKESRPLEEIGREIRSLILQGQFPSVLSEEITEAYKTLGKSADVAVRSSATAEDLPDASFAGQQETFFAHPRRRDGARCLQKMLCFSFHRQGYRLPRGEKF